MTTSPVTYCPTEEQIRRAFEATAPGPAVIKPMIQLRSIMDGGSPMTVTSADYADPERWWL